MEKVSIQKENYYFILDLIKNNCSITIKEISLKLGISTRTVYRDMKYLNKNSIPCSKYYFVFPFINLNISPTPLQFHCQQFHLDNKEYNLLEVEWQKNLPLPHRYLF